MKSDLRLYNPGDDLVPEPRRAARGLTALPAVPPRWRAGLFRVLDTLRRAWGAGTSLTVGRVLAMSRPMNPPARLPEPEVLSCFFTRHAPPMPAMRLRWHGGPVAPRGWPLPDGSILLAGLPAFFGVVVHRTALDGYAVRMLWDDATFVWDRLTRRALLDSCLNDVLAALGTDLSFLLDQPPVTDTLPDATRRAA
jgi:hypothetical protein